MEGGGYVYDTLRNIETHHSSEIGRFRQILYLQAVCDTPIFFFVFCLYPPADGENKA